MSHAPVGIDLGTSTSVVSVFVDGKPVPVPDPDTKSSIVPSVVGLSRTLELLVGQRAVDRSFGPELRETKREMGRGVTYKLGDGEYSSEEVAAIILRRLKLNAEVYLGEPITEVVISVPANYEDTRRRAVVKAAELAGLKVLRLINEPTAAAMAYGIRALNAMETLLVYDFGGGTLDVSILDMIEGVLDVRTSHGVAELGGKDFDSCIMQWAVERFEAQYPGATRGEEWEKRLKRAAEAAKKDLSQDAVAALYVQNFAVHAGEMVDMDISITRPEFERLVSPLIEQSLAAIDAALNKAGMHQDRITQVLLVGGTTWIPCVREAVLRRLGRPLVSGCDPDLAVSMGAAISAALASGQVDTQNSVLVQDVCTYGLGTLTVQQIGGRMQVAYEELMPPNTPVPYSVTRSTYSLLRTDQDEMELELVQDLTGKAILPEDTVPTGCSGTLSGIPPSRTETPHRVALEFQYDVNGIVQLRAWLPDLDDYELTLTHSMSDSETERREKSLDHVNDLWEKSPLAQRYMLYVRRAEKVLEESPHNSEAIRAALVDLKASISMNDENGSVTACDRLVELLADI